MSTPLRILLCRCSQSARVDHRAVDEILDALTGSDALITVADDLCGLAASNDPLLAEIAAAPGSAVIACHTRAIRWLFAAAGYPLDNSPTALYSLRRQSAAEIISALDAGVGESQIDIVAGETDWSPWFPVIDRDRCVNCMQCMNFCLFGTYSLSADKKVVVSKPTACKNLCPACARICPNSAIIFPKYEQSPIDGADVPEESEGPAVDLQALTKGDIYARLRQRSGGQRFSPTRDQEPQTPPPPDDLADRLGIPPEVIAAMSPEEIRRICDRGAECEAPGCSCNKNTDDNQDPPAHDE